MKVYEMVRVMKRMRSRTKSMLVRTKQFFVSLFYTTGSSHTSIV